MEGLALSRARPSRGTGKKKAAEGGIALTILDQPFLVPAVLTCALEVSRVRSGEGRHGLLPGLFH